MVIPGQPGQKFKAMEPGCDVLRPEVLEMVWSTLAVLRPPALSPKTLGRTWAAKNGT